ncbi:MAG: sigma-70 family RNA polymerase sigma factor [Deltaproteobacteria bacterium]
MSVDDRQIVRRAFADEDEEALEQLLCRLVPIIRARAARALRRGPIGAHDVADLVQEIWIALIADGGRRLLTYDPAHGLTLEGFVGLIAEREIASMQRKVLAKKRGGDLRIVSDDGLTVAACGGNPEDEAVTNDLAARLAAHLDAQLPVRGRLVWRLAFNDGQSTAEVARNMGVSQQVVYNWQHKIRALARAFLK